MLAREAFLEFVQPHFAGLRAASARLPGVTAGALQSALLRLRSEMPRAVGNAWLRLRLKFQPEAWFAAIPGRIDAGFEAVGRAVEQISWHAAKTAIRAIRWREVALVASTPFVLPAEWRGALVRILAYLAAIYAMTLIATGLFRASDPGTALPPAPRALWTEVDNPWPAFQLTASSHDADSSVYAIHRHALGGRKDILSFGELGNTQRFMTFEIYRAGRELEHFSAPVEEVHALGSEQGRVLGIRSSLPIRSKFGPFQTFEFGIGPFGGYNCIGFVRAFDSPRVQISGLSCGMNLLVDRSAISCALDRLTLLSAGSDPDIAKLFAHAEQKRHFCGQRDPLLYATPRRPTDVTSAAVGRTRLRGRIAR